MATRAPSASGTWGWRCWCPSGSAQVRMGIGSNLRLWDSDMLLPTPHIVGDAASISAATLVLQCCTSYVCPPPAVTFLPTHSPLPSPALRVSYGLCFD